MTSGVRKPMGKYKNSLRSNLLVTVKRAFSVIDRYWDVALVAKKSTTSVSFDLVEEYMEQHSKTVSCGRNDSNFRENALFQDYHGLLSFRKGMANFMEETRGGRAKFKAERIVLTAGSTAANELLTFILANPGDSLLVPTPYYPGINRKRLKQRYQMMVNGLRNIGIECLEGNAGLFCWINLNSILKEATREYESEVWRLILEEVKLNVCPGSSCHCCEVGWFRVCFANMSEQTLVVALERMHGFMKRRNIRRND
ncbi:hypothetical protein LguiB_011828 [Lonicera macranthoides]